MYVAKVTKSSRKTINIKNNEIQTPLSPSGFVKAIDFLHSHNQFKKNKIEISLRKKDGSTVEGIYLGQHGKSREGGYRYTIESEIGTSQDVWVKDIDEVMELKIVSKTPSL